MPAVLFDLDGTLIDSVPDLHTAVNRVLAEVDLPEVTLGQIRAFVGHGARVLLARALRATGPEPTEHDIEAAYRRFEVVYLERVCVDTTLYPGARALLDGLRRRGWRLALVTNKPEAHARSIVAALGIAASFEVVLGGDSLPTRKPDPAMVHTALHALGSRAAESWLVGDSPVDLEAGRNAGVGVVLVDFGYTPVPAAQLGADAVVSELLAVSQVVGPPRQP